MIKTLLKHTIFELCIDQFFGAVVKNFVQPKNLIISHQAFTRLVCAERSGGVTTGYVLYNTRGVEVSMVNGVQAIQFKTPVMRITQIEDNTGRIVYEKTICNTSKWVTKDMLVDIDI